MTTKPVSFLDKTDGLLLLDTIALDYVEPIMNKDLKPSSELLVLELSKKPEDEKDKQNTIQGFVQFINATPKQFYMYDVSLPVQRLLLKHMKYISEHYDMFLNNTNIETRNNFFYDIYQKWVDIVSLLFKEQSAVKGLVFLLNIITKNGFFNFVKVNDKNPNIKILRNIREHDKIILDRDTYDEHYPDIAKELHYYKSGRELEELRNQIFSGDKVVMFDRNDKGYVNTLIIEDPRFFLKKIITFGHIVLFCFKINEKLVVSEELFTTYWAKKYNIEALLLRKMTVEEHLNTLSAARMRRASDTCNTMTQPKDARTS